MAVKITMPQLSQTTDEVILMRWLVQEGDEVKKGDALCEVENDKTTMTVESFTSGTVMQLIGEPDETITSGTIIAVIGEKDESLEFPGAERAPGSPEPETRPPKREMKEMHRRTITRKTRDNRGILATPLVRNIAAKHKVDLAHVRGTGPEGLITKKDIEDYLKTGTVPVAEPPEKGEMAAEEKPAGGSMKEGQSVELSSQQKIVARRLEAAATKIPHYYLRSTIIMDSLLRWRENHTDNDGKKYSMTALFLWAVSKTLSEFPGFNSLFQSDRLKIYPSHHIGFALTHGDDLFVPIIRDVQEKTKKELNREVRELTAKVRDGSAAAKNFTDGTFTVTNLGMYPIDDFAAVINPPQTAILAFARIQKKITVDDENSMSIKQVCIVTGSFDHRIINGARGAAFMGRLKENMEKELFQ